MCGLASSPKIRDGPAQANLLYRLLREKPEMIVSSSGVLTNMRQKSVYEEDLGDHAALRIYKSGHYAWVELLCRKTHLARTGSAAVLRIHFINH